MCGRHLDGIVLEPVGDNHQYLTGEIDAGAPIVAFDRPAGGILVDTVISDNAAGIGTAFRHLRGHGHHRVAYIGDEERIFTGHERAAAFRACMAASGEPVTGLAHPGVVSPGRIAAALDAALRGPDPATALITGNASTTLEVLLPPRLPPPRAWRSSGSTTSPWPTCSGRRSPSSPRTAAGWAARKIDLLRHRMTDHTRPVQTVTVGVGACCGARLRRTAAGRVARPWVPYDGSVVPGTGSIPHPRQPPRRRCARRRQMTGRAHTRPSPCRPCHRFAPSS